MSLKATNLVKPNTYEVEITSTAEEFENAIEQTYRRQRNRINVPGFRKGKAPRKMIEKLYGETVFYDDAINALINPVVIPAVEETGLELVDRPEIDVTSISREDGVVFKVTCITKPEITLEKYKGIEAVKESPAVSDKDVDDAIERERKKNARIIAVDRAAENGDTANINFVGYIDGEAFEGGSEDNYDLALGSNTFIPGFEAQLVGHKAGDDVTVNVTFPEDYQMEEIAGKPAEFEVHINSVSTEELPELDDDFAMDVSEFDTLDEYKADLRKRLEENAAIRAEEITQDRVFTKLTEYVGGDIPEVMYEKRMDYHMEMFKRRIASQGISMEMYTMFSGQSEKDLREGYRANSIIQVKADLAFEYVAKAENLEVTADEIEAKFAEIAKDAGTTVEHAKAALSADTIKEELLIDKAKRLVFAEAVLTDAPAEEAKSE